MVDKQIAWSFSGAAARAIALFKQAQAAIELTEKPNIIIGQSSGAIVAPIVAVAYDDPKLLKAAIEMAETLDIEDMFPYKGNVPMTKSGKPTVGGIVRAFTHNHLGWQDIKPMYKKIFTEEHFKLFKNSSIKCIGFGVRGKDWMPTMFNLSEAENLDDLIDMIEATARIVPFVQPMEYKGDTYVDGGFISFNPAKWLFNNHELKSLLMFNSHPVKLGIPVNEKWDDTILTITNQAMQGLVNQLAVAYMELAELYCIKTNVNYIIVEAPEGYTDEIYETDDDQLKALGNAAYENASKILNPNINIC
jgi:predicted acylesterase/phospholipase RssA